MTDGSLSFDAVVGAMRLLQMHGYLPEVIVVGISYAFGEDGWNSEDEMIRRTRDLTPTVDKEYLENMQSYFDVPLDKEPGQSDKFLAFIDTELKPYINANYRTDIGDQTFMGHSSGGLFAFDILFNHTDSFDKYVILSPYIPWDNFSTYEVEADYAKKHTDLPKRIFIGVGELEIDDQFVEPFTTIIKKLKGRNYPNLIMDHHLFMDENHISVIAASHIMGLRKVFKDQVPRQ